MKIKKMSLFKIGCCMIALGYTYDMGYKKCASDRVARTRLISDSQIASHKYEIAEKFKKRRYYFDTLKDLTFDVAVAKIKTSVFGN